jgi:hypothetical protein
VPSKYRTSSSKPFSLFWRQPIYLDADIFHVKGLVHIVNGLGYFQKTPIQGNFHPDQDLDIAQEFPHSKSLIQFDRKQDHPPFFQFQQGKGGDIPQRPATLPFVVNQAFSSMGFRGASSTILRSYSCARRIHY